MASLGGRYRQRGTGRLLGYWAAYAVAGGTTTYAAVITDGDRFMVSRDGRIDFDLAEMTAEEAARQDIGRFIGATAFGDGEQRQPNWTNFGPWK